MVLLATGINVLTFMLWLRRRRREGAAIIDYFDELEEGFPNWIGDVWQLPDENAWITFDCDPVRTEKGLKRADFNAMLMKQRHELAEEYERHPPPRPKASASCKSFNVHVSKG
jgi:hypothetical protein